MSQRRGALSRTYPRHAPNSAGEHALAEPGGKQGERHAGRDVRDPRDRREVLHVHEPLGEGEAGADHGADHDAVERIVDPAPQQRERPQHDQGLRGLLDEPGPHAQRRERVRLQQGGKNGRGQPERGLREPGQERRHRGAERQQDDDVIDRVPLVGIGEPQEQDVHERQADDAQDGQCDQSCSSHRQRRHVVHRPSRPSRARPRGVPAHRQGMPHPAHEGDHSRRRRWWPARGATGGPR